MQYWTGGRLFEFLLICVCLGVSASLRSFIAREKSSWVLPDALLAGILGFVVGPSVLAWIDFSPHGFQQIVYHGLAIVFVAVSLQSPLQHRDRQRQRGFVFAIPAIAVIQAIVGLSFVWMWNTSSSQQLHPGFGLMLPLGFNQSPGAAMTLGSAWEKTCQMADGGQIGLIVAAIGYAWCCVGGVALIVFGKLRGWLRSEQNREGEDKPSGEPESLKQSMSSCVSSSEVNGLRMDGLTAQVVIIAVVYTMTFGFLGLISPLITQIQHRATLWGFHFLIALGFAVVTRKIIVWSQSKQLLRSKILDDGMLRRVTSFSVDITTVAAIAALRLEVLRQWLLPLLIMTSICGGVTLLLCIWVGPRAFLRDRFAHVVMLFGAMTGTTPTGLALLGTIDPGLKGPVARNYVHSAAAAAIFGIPLFLMMPIPVVGWPQSYPGALFKLIGGLVFYLMILLILWRFKGGLRSQRPHFRLWVQDEN